MPKLNASRLQSAVRASITRLPQKRIERAIIASRTALSVGGFIAVYLDRSQHFEPLTYVPLGAYVAFSFLMLSTYRQPRGGLWPLATHIVETTLICLILTRTEGPASPFFVYFTFVILAGALRWQGPGALITGAALGSTLLAMTATQFLVNFDQTVFTDLVLRNIYLIVVTLLFAYLGTEWRRSGQILERLEFADEIHDGLLQTVSAIRLKAYTLAARLHAGERERAIEIAQLLATEQERLRSFISEVRDAYSPGGPGTVLPIGQVQEVAFYLERLLNSSIRIEIDRPNAPVPRGVCFAIREIITESIANAVLQGLAQRATVTIECRETAVRLRIQDDRRVLPEPGEYETGELLPKSGPSRVVKERVDSIGGLMQFKSSGGGVLLEIELPIVDRSKRDTYAAA